MRQVVIGGPPPPRRLPSVVVLGAAAVAVAIGLVVVAVFPRQAPPARPRAVSQSPLPPGGQQWGAIYQEIRRIPVRVEAPGELPGGHRLTSMSVWRPGWFGSGTVWHWVLVDGEGRWIQITADPTTRHKVGSDEVRDVPGVGSLRSLESSDLTALEWDTPGYAMRIEAGGVPTAELERVAAGIVPPAEPSLVADEPPELGHVPAGFTLISRTEGAASTAGPGEAGWRAGYLLEGGEGRTVSITAAEGRGFPFAELFEAAPAQRGQIRGSRGLVFDYPGASEISLTTTRSRLIWLEEGSMLEATSNRLDADELLELITPLDLVPDD